MDDEVKLPPLPESVNVYYDDIDEKDVHCYSADQVQIYARTAILADRAARAQPAETLTLCDDHCWAGVGDCPKCEESAYDPRPIMQPAPAEAAPVAPVGLNWEQGHAAVRILWNMSYEWDGANWFAASPATAPQASEKPSEDEPLNVSHLAHTAAVAREYERGFIVGQREMRAAILASHAETAPQASEPSDGPWIDLQDPGRIIPESERRIHRKRYAKEALAATQPPHGASELCKRCEASIILSVSPSLVVNGTNAAMEELSKRLQAERGASAEAARAGDAKTAEALTAVLNAWPLPGGMGLNDAQCAALRLVDAALAASRPDSGERAA